MADYDIYLAANRRLDALIDVSPLHDRTLAAVQARAAERLARMSDFLAFLGNPHRAAPVIHVAGTSGKGSTATAIASILRAGGHSTLLHTSPYLQVATEKLQIDGQLIDAINFAELAGEVIDAADRFGHDHLTYGEAWMAIVALAISRYKPDVAVIEVGAGGRFDLTNVVDPAVAVITTVGIDHTETLGSTIPEIAWHKAGIIKPNVAVVHSVDQPDARAEIDRQIAQAGAAAPIVIEPADLQVERGSDGHVTWIDSTTCSCLRAGVPGFPQAQNGAVAVAAVRAFDQDIAITAVERGLEQTRIAARFERMPDPAFVVLDGAHNVQKMIAVLPDLRDLPRPRVAVIGFLAAKRSDEMVQLLGPCVDHIAVARPDVLGKPGRDVAQTAESVRKHVAIPVVEAVDPLTAFSMARTIAGVAGSVIVTGSLYLCGAIREQWYSSRAIVEQQTQWPEISPRPQNRSN
jgi:dihydrofolate synthase/folylpolyglutamate synthase